MLFMASAWHTCDLFLWKMCLSHLWKITSNTVGHKLILCGSEQCERRMCNHIGSHKLHKEQLSLGLLTFICISFQTRPILFCCVKQKNKNVAPMHRSMHLKVMNKNTRPLNHCKLCIVHAV